MEDGVQDSLRPVSRAGSTLSTTSSLSRKPRTRARSRTLTGEQSPTVLSVPFSPPPDRPPRSPRRLADSPEPESPGNTVFDTAKEEETDETPIVLDDARSFASHRRPPKQILTNPTRDSVSTNNSFASSSIYPFTASTVSGTEDSLPSPRSVLQLQDNQVRSVDPQDEDMHAYDGEDASYRLRLLMQNQFFLPPAHSKPTSSDFASQIAQKPVRTAPPTFLDLFRVGKSKSRPTTPISSPPAFDTLTPILRTTSDSTTASGHVPRSNPPLSPRPAALPDRSGRVVVVREKIEDVATAARQAEQEMQVREARREREGGSHRVREDVFLDVDPTDAVDLPPPSKDAFFAPVVDAAALSDMTVLQPSFSSLDPMEDAWRKNLLQAAVNLSLHSSTPSSSSMSMPPTSPVPAARPRLSSRSRSRAPSVKRMLGQRIVDRPLDDERPVPPMPSSPLPRERGPNLGTHEPQSRASYLPSRATTPLVPTTPLGPPPRNHIKEIVHAISQRDFRSSTSSRSRSHSAHSIRRAMSSPMLSGTFLAGERQLLSMTPPPLPRRSPVPSSSNLGRQSVDTQRPTESIGSASVYSVDDELGDSSRPSMANSLPLESRPSVSEYSQPSPTASAFREWSGGGRSSVSSALTIDQATSSPLGSRGSTVSPPPRVSSSLAYLSLHPPPQRSSRPQSGGEPSSLAGPMITIEPVSPSYTPKRHPLTPLIIPTGPPMALAIHSAPAPADGNSTSFFDSIQAQPNAMDDLDSSDEDDEETTYQNPPRQTLQPPGRTSGSSSPRPLYTTSIKSASTASLGSIGDPMQPVSYEQPRPTFFASKKKKTNIGIIHIPPPLPEDQALSEDLRRPSTAAAESVAAFQSSQQDLEEVRKFDSMLVRHMEKEKVTLKRIASRQ